jgi:uncharacterized membrane protein
MSAGGEKPVPSGTAGAVPMSTSPQPPSIFGGETHRLSALTDGVFSIVMTLMVIDLALPKDRPTEALSRALLDLWPNFLAYAISFGLLGIYWLAHHGMFRFIRRTSHELVWLNVVFLAFVSLVPFSTAVLSAHHTEPLALGIYGGTLTLIGLALLPLWLHATRGRRLVDPDLPEGVVRYGFSRVLVGVVGYSLATILAVVRPWLGLVVFAAVPLLYILPPVQVFWWRRFGLGASSVPGAPTAPEPE